MFNKAQKMIEKQKHNNSTETAILPMQCYVQPFWKHSDLEIYNESNLDTMSRMPDNCIDLTVTSPPYDDLRNYNGYAFDLDAIIKELYRVTKKGGVVVWVVGDKTKDGCETLTSFKQAISFVGFGWKLHDTMIYAKENYIPLTHNRYEQQFEYMFVFSKGKPKTFNPIKIPSIHSDRTIKRTQSNHGENKSIRERTRIEVANTEKIKPNIWFYKVGTNTTTKDAIAFKHPAIFPEQLATDHILSWSNEGDVIYEPFGGSGTTCKMAYLSKRKSIMSEISTEYCELSRRRLSEYLPKRLFA